MRSVILFEESVQYLMVTFAAKTMSVMDVMQPFTV